MPLKMTAGATKQWTECNKRCRQSARLYSQRRYLPMWRFMKKKLNVVDEQCAVAFYRTALYAGRSFLWASVRPSVCLSVRPSVKRVNCDKTKAPSEKSSIMTNRKSPTSFPMSLRWTAYVAPNPPKGASKTTIFFFFRMKNWLRSKKVCCKVSLCENCQRQSCKAFTGLSIRAQMVGGGMSPSIP